MKNSHHAMRRAMLAATLLAAMPAMSIGSYAAMSSALPPEQHQGVVTYMSGGIGHDESAALLREESTFPLSLEFVEHAKPKAEYLAGVKVTIKDRQGKTMLNAVADGPLLLARLPDGKYTVTAEDNGRMKERSVVISQRKQEHAVFIW